MQENIVQENTETVERIRKIHKMTKMKPWLHYKNHYRLFQKC